MTDKDKFVDKIRKCMALANSANEHEAAAALRQAQKLMQIHRVTDAELLAAGVGQSGAHAGATKTPPRWESNLAATVADAFFCRIVFVSFLGGAKWNFIGIGGGADVAQYAFAVLYRQLRRSRAAFILAKCKRLKPTSKTRRADLFCDAWVHAVAEKAQAMAGQEGDAEAIDAYMLQHYPELGDMKPRDRNADRKLRDKDWDAVAAGASAGRKAQLNHGVSGTDGPALIGA